MIEISEENSTNVIVETEEIVVPTGVLGPTGATGATGPKGDKGEKGDNGKDGSNGIMIYAGDTDATKIEKLTSALENGNLIQSVFYKSGTFNNIYTICNYYSYENNTQVFIFSSFSEMCFAIAAFSLDTENTLKFSENIYEWEEFISDKITDNSYFASFAFWGDGTTKEFTYTFDQYVEEVYAYTPPLITLYKKNSDNTCTLIQPSIVWNGGKTITITLDQPLAEGERLQGTIQYGHAMV